MDRPKTSGTENPSPVLASTSTEDRPPLAMATPGRLKPPSKISHVAVKPMIELSELVNKNKQEQGDKPGDVGLKHKEPSPGPEDFKVHTTSLKRKPEATALSRNTRPRTELPAFSTSTKPARSVPARTTTTARTTATTSKASASSARLAAGTTASSRAKAASSAAKPAAASKSEQTVTQDTSNGPIKKKRAAWDVKGRLQDLEEYHQNTQSQLQDSKSQLTSMTDELARSRTTIDELFQFRKSLENQVVVKEKESHNYAQQLGDVKSELQSAKRLHDEELYSLKTAHSREVDDLKLELASLKRAHESITEELRSARDENATLRSTISTQSALSVTIEAEMRANKMRLEQTEEIVRIRDARISQLEGLLKNADENVEMLEGKVREEETVRRRLHNTILELKGNIRVFCRVRPPLAHELEERKDEIMTHINFTENDEKAIELTQAVESASGQKTVAKSYPFAFDKVFQPPSSQSEVFEEISQLVQSALDGYNVCIFAYGQTGSGKTFTMEGPGTALENSENMGMIPRAVHQIFEAAKSLKEKGWVYQMEAQFLEIYNESIRDLIGGGGEGRHEIKHVGNRTTVTDVQTVEVQTPREVYSVLKKAALNRAVAATNCNERSSRSHSVFTLRLTGTNTLTQETSSGILNLIDLAGSERLSSSGSTGDRLKETQAINKSLSCLGDVIYALGNGDKHVPYRNSKLTYLLSGSLGGNSKTLMFVNVSPLAASFQETLCSLRFATKVNSCQIGTAKKMVK